MHLGLGYQSNGLAKCEKEAHLEDGLARLERRLDCACQRLIEFCNGRGIDGSTARIDVQTHVIRATLAVDGRHLSRLQEEHLAHYLAFLA